MSNKRRSRNPRSMGGDRRQCSRTNDTPRSGGGIIQQLHWGRLNPLFYNRAARNLWRFLGCGLHPRPDRHSIPTILLSRRRGVRSKRRYPQRRSAAVFDGALRGPPVGDGAPSNPLWTSGTLYAPGPLGTATLVSVNLPHPLFGVSMLPGREYFFVLDFPSAACWSDSPTVENCAILCFYGWNFAGHLSTTVSNPV